MLTIAYLANQFPAAVEAYVGEEIDELRRRGVRVIPTSVRIPGKSQRKLSTETAQTAALCLQTIRVMALLHALILIGRRWKATAGLITEALFCREEPIQRRLKALLHTCLGAYYAAQLQKREVSHIHVHHGYFGSWIAMAAARFLRVPYSLTLHGSDLLVNQAYLATKLENSRFCLTISEFNRRYILEHFPKVDLRKILVSRLGVEIVKRQGCSQIPVRDSSRALTLLAVGRLHSVKDHAFLIRACGRMRDRGIRFTCSIAGEGPERGRLGLLIQQNQLQSHVTLLGHMPGEQTDLLYRCADVVVLTSRSEGIPLVLMEAMTRGRLVLAPKITGVPEIVLAGKTGFLYVPGDLEDFVEQIFLLQQQLNEEDRSRISRLDWIRHAARAQVSHNFNRSKNLTQFADQFLQLVADKDLALPA